MTHPETGEFYIGRRTSNKPAIEDTKYRGSSSTWYDTLTKDIIGNILLKEILEEFTNPDDLNLAEIKWITENIENPLCMNAHIPSIGFYCKGPLSEEHKLAISNALIGKIGKIWINDGIESTTVNSISDIPKGWVLGRLPFTESHKKNISKNLKGKSLSGSHKLSISESLKNSDKLKEVMNTDEYRQKISNALKGRQFTEEHKQKLSNSNKGRIFTEEHKQKLRESRKKRIFSEDTKRKISESKKGTKYKKSNEDDIEIKSTDIF